MAEENDAASKTEEASPRKLDEARKKGDVAKTQDLAPFAALAAAVGVLALLGGPLCQRLALDLARFVAHAHDLSLSEGKAADVMMLAAKAAAPPLLAVMLAAGVAGAAGNLVQHGLLWAPEKLKPSLKKVSPLEGFKRIFGPDALFQFGKTFVKLLAVGVVTWMVAEPRLAELTGLSALDVSAILPETRDVVQALVFAVLVLLAAITGGDWLFQRFRFTQRMRMTRQETKEEYRQSEGDPHVRAKLKQMRAEKGRSRMMQNLPKATVVVMNPTHYAVALRYEPGETAAPVCLAKGLDQLALRIRAVAEEFDVPVVEDPPLARALYAAVDVDKTIPREHFEAVAKVIGFVLSAREKPRAAPLRP